MIRVKTLSCIKIRVARPSVCPGNTFVLPALRQGFVRQLCSQPSPPAAKEPKEPIYIGTFGDMLKLLRRVSLASATLSVTSLPVMMLLTGSNPSLGTSVILGTAVFMATGSTIFLKLMSYPYVVKMVEASSSTNDDRSFIAYRLGMLGTPYPTEFKLSEVEHVKVTQHPFASFRVKSDYFFVFEQVITEDGLRDKFDNEKMKSVVDGGVVGASKDSSEIFKK